MFFKTSCDDEDTLENCYLHAFKAAFTGQFSSAVQEHHSDNMENDLHTVLCTPLIGSGCRNWPNVLAAEIAIKAIRKFSQIENKGSGSISRHIGLVVVDKQVGDIVIQAAEKVFSNSW